MRVMSLASLILSAENVIAFTGAGISTESGLPDFRGPNGLWTKDPAAAEMFNIRSFKSRQRVRDRYWESRLGTTGTVFPNAGHLALADLYRSGKLSAVVTQNIDGLHQAAGVPDEIVFELHGSLSHVSCWGCGLKLDMADFLKVANVAPWTPATYRCPDCRKLFKPGVVLFGEPLDEAVFDAAVDVALAADLLLVLGSSLSVYPAAGIVGLAQQRGVPTVIVNHDPTDYDTDAVLVLRDSIGAVLQGALS